MAIPPIDRAGDFIGILLRGKSSVVMVVVSLSLLIFPRPSQGCF